MGLRTWRWSKHDVLQASIDPVCPERFGILCDLTSKHLTLIPCSINSYDSDYPNNAYSNKRWCCYDNGMTHFDLSI